MKRAIVYIRVSTARQEEEGVSRQAQAARCQAWADFNGYIAPVYYIERGTSGRRADNRPALQAAISECQRGDTFIVYSLSRMARSNQDAAAILAELQSKGADFASATENIDTTSAAGKMIFHILAALAQFESELISERVTAAMEHLKSNKRVYHRLPVYGYDSVDGQLIPVAAEQKIIRKIQREHERGKSLRAIAAALNNGGVATKRGGAAWYASTVKGILQNELHAAA